MHSSRGRYMVTQSANRSPMGAVDHKLLPTPTMHPNVSAVPLLSRHMLTNQALQVVFCAGRGRPLIRLFTSGTNISRVFYVAFGIDSNSGETLFSVSWQPTDIC